MVATVSGHAAEAQACATPLDGPASAMEREDMLYALALAIVVAAVLLVVLMRRGRTDGRGDLLGPPPSLGAKARLASLQTPAAPSPPAERPWPDGAAPIGDLADRVAAEARRLVAQDRKLEAIKLVRAATHWDLGKAKAWVERL